MIVLGTDIQTGEPVSLTDEQVCYHTTILGLTGTGKSTAITTHVKQAMEQGHGIIVLDPHGTLVDRILLYIPPGREKDVIILDIRDIEFPFALNLFGSDSKTLLDEDPFTLVTDAFKRVWGDSWGPNIPHWLMLIAEVFEANGHGTLADVPRFFTDKEFRDSLLANADEEIVDAIRKDEAQNGELRGGEINSTYKRMLRFLRKRKLRNIVSQEDTRFSFLEAMNSGKIVLFSLKADPETVNLIGTVILGRILSAAMARKEYQEPYCFVYVDEFQRFATDTFSDIIQQVRKFNVGLILATQSLFVNVSEKVREGAELVNTLLLYRVGQNDAAYFANKFRHIAFDKPRPVPHPNPAEELLRHPHPDKPVRDVVDSLIRPFATVEKNSIARYAFEGMSTYLRSMQEQRLFSGTDEARALKQIFYNLPAHYTLIYQARQVGGEIAGKQMQERIEAYIETFCRIVRVNHSRSTLRPVLSNHREFSQVKAIFGRDPVEDRVLYGQYTRLVTDLYNLRWLGFLLAENPIPAEGIKEVSTREIANQLQNVPQGKAALWTFGKEYVVSWSQPQRKALDEAMRERIIARSRELYCTPREEITRRVTPKIADQPQDIEDEKPKRRREPTSLYEDLPPQRRRRATS